MYNRYSVFLLKQFYHSKGSLSHLPPRDRDVMVTSNYDTSMALVMASAMKCERYRLNKNKLSVFTHEDFLKTFLDFDYDSIRTVKEIYSKKSKNGTLPPINLTFKRAYPPELFKGDKQLEENFKAMVGALNNWPDDLLHDNSFIPLLVHLFLNTPDFLNLERPDIAATSQTYITGLIYRYVILL